MELMKTAKLRLNAQEEVSMHFKKYEIFIAYLRNFPSQLNKRLSRGGSHAPDLTSFLMNDFHDTFAPEFSANILIIKCSSKSGLIQNQMEINLIYKNQ